MEIGIEQTSANNALSQSLVDSLKLYDSSKGIVHLLTVLSDALGDTPSRDSVAKVIASLKDDASLSSALEQIESQLDPLFLASIRSAEIENSNFWLEPALKVYEKVTRYMELARPRELPSPQLEGGAIAIAIATAWKAYAENNYLYCYTNSLRALEPYFHYFGQAHAHAVLSDLKDERSQHERVKELTPLFSDRLSYWLALTEPLGQIGLGFKKYAKELLKRA